MQMYMILGIRGILQLVSTFCVHDICLPVKLNPPGRSRPDILCIAFILTCAACARSSSSLEVSCPLFATRASLDHTRLVLQIYKPPLALVSLPARQGRKSLGSVSGETWLDVHGDVT